MPRQADCQQERKCEFRKFPVFEYIFQEFRVELLLKERFVLRKLCLELSLEEFDLPTYLVRIDF